MHDLRPAIATGLRDALRFGGRQSRAGFWLWIAALTATFALAQQIESLLFHFSDSRENWPSVDQILQSLPHLKFYLSFVASAWPSSINLVPFPLGYTLESIVFYELMPLFVLIHLLALAPIVHRSRDAGYRPFLTIILAYWAVFGTAALVLVSVVIGMISETGVWCLLLSWSGGALTRINAAIAVIAAITALYRLTAPSIPSPISTEALK